MSKSFEFIAKTFHGLEEVLAKELKNTSAKDIQIQNRAVRFKGSLKTMYEANYLCRTALRILKPLHTFKVTDAESLYKGVREINWFEHLTIHDTFVIDSLVFSKAFNHSKFPALKAKDAISDQFREKYNLRPSVDTTNPTIRINLHIANETGTISLDSSGETLNKRNYRKETGPAPLNEALAAGMIYLTEWNQEDIFIDPMCGSGTILIEAAMIALNIPAGIKRKFWAFQNWNDYNPRIWREVKETAEDKRNKKADLLFSGIDKDKKVVELARRNVRNIGLSEYIHIDYNELEYLEAPEDKGVMVTNPPYGERIKPEEIERLYKQIGDKLKNEFAGYEAWILSGNKNAMKNLGLKPMKKHKLFNGALECKYNQYKIYEGSKKNTKKE